MRARELAIALSPYHFTSREVAAIASIQLADRVVTILPAAPSRDASERAALTLPKYRRLVEAWSWAEPLLASGAVAPAWEGDDPMADVRAVCEAIEERPAWEALRPLMRTGLFESQSETLEAVAADLLKGGPDPGLLIPISAAIDRFAARHAIGVARSGRESVAQKAEQRLGTRLLALSLPLLSQAEPERLVEARASLAPTLGALRHELAEAAALVTIDGPAALSTEQLARIEAAAADHAGAFTDVQGELTRCDDVYDLRVRVSTVSLTLSALPVDAVLRSSVEATGSLGRPARSARRASATAPAPVQTAALAPMQADERGWVFSLTIRAIGARR